MQTYRPENSKSIGGVFSHESKMNLKSGQASHKPCAKTRSSSEEGKKNVGIPPLCPEPSA